MIREEKPHNVYSIYIHFIIYICVVLRYIAYINASKFAWNANYYDTDFQLL